MSEERSRRMMWVGALVLLAACGSEPPSGGGSADQPLSALPEHGPVASSPQGMVVTGSPHATEAGRRMLALGGNAVDAAVAAAFTLAVAEPTQTGLGGRTQALVRLADGTVHGVDGTTQVPAVYDPTAAPTGNHGHGAVGIPGTVAALTRILEEHGTLPLGRVLEPARAWAGDGMVLTEGEAGRLAGLVPELDPDSELARIFGARGGEPLEPGARLVQPELARVLEALARDGRDAFYGGEIAVRMAEDMAANGGFVTLEDLATYRAEDAQVGHGRYRGLELVGSYLPASGVTVIEILQILDRLSLPAQEGPWAATLAEGLLAGFEDREIAESWAPSRAVAWLTSDTLADRRAREIAERLDAAGVQVAGSTDGGSPVGGARRIAGALLPRASGAVDTGTEPAFTTHLSVADTFGNVAAVTQSLGPTGGARVVTPGLGFLYASTLGGYLSGGEPGYRPWSSQAPLLVLEEGRPRLVMGGAGARRILSALVATVTRVVDQGMSLEAAMAAPRLHPTGGEILVEEGWSGIPALEALGYAVAPRERSYFARLNVVEVLEDGAFRGVAEPRWIESAAAGPGGGP